MNDTTPSNLKYTQEHEWALVEENIATIGITDFAQKSLGDVVFVELPEVGTHVEKGSTFGVIESIKSVSDLYVPLSGEIVEVNSALEDEPALVNNSPYESWLVKIKFINTDEIDSLLNDQDYLKVISNA